MRAAIPLRNGVGEAKYVFLVRIVPLHGQLHRHLVTLHIEGDHRLMQRRLIAVQVPNKLGDAALVFEMVFLANALVRQDDLHSRVEKREFAQPLRQNVVMKLNIGKHFATGQEPDFRSGAV